MRESVPVSGLGFIRDFIRFSSAAGNPHHSEVVAELGTADGIDGMKSAAISRRETCITMGLCFESFVEFYLPLLPAITRGGCSPAGDIG